MKTHAATIEHARSFLQGVPSVAKILIANAKRNGATDPFLALRTNDVLRKDEWELLDDLLIGVARQRLIGINDLRSAGLVENLGGLGIMFSEYEKLGDMSAASVDFAAVTDTEKDSVTFSLTQVPVPIISKEFSINIRRQMASQGPNAKGQPIDRVQVEVAAQKVVEGAEDLLFLGYSGGNLNGVALYGYTNEPNVNTAGGSDWATVGNPTADVITAIAGCEADNYFGPFTLYVATTQFGELRNFYTDGSGDTSMTRLQKINSLSGVRPGDRMTAGTAVLVSMRRDVVDVAIGQDLTVVEWDTKGGLTANFKVMTALAPRVKSDAASKSGIFKLTGI